MKLNQKLSAQFCSAGSLHILSALNLTVAAWTALMCILPNSGVAAGPLPDRTTYDFSTDWPSGVSTSNVQIKDGALVLAQDASGNYLSEGYVDIPVPPLHTEGRVIVVDATRMDSLVAGDFEGLSGHVTNLYSATGTYYKPRAVGSDADVGSAWFSENKWPSNTPNLVPDTSGNVAAEINRQASLEQFFAAAPGEDYRLSFDLDPTRLCVESNQVFTINLSFFTDNYSTEFGTLEFRNPRTGDATTSYQIDSSGPEDGIRRVSLRFRILDADDHEQYVDDAGVTHYFNYSTFPDGTSMEVTNDLGGTVLSSSYSNGDIEYSEISFNTQWIGTSAETGFNTNVAILDNVTLDREDQIEVALLNAAGEILQRSTLTSGFMVEAAPSTLRLYLRSHIPSRTPEVRSLILCDALPITVPRGPKLATISEPRLGFTGYIPPTLEWFDETIGDMRTRCVDIFAGDGSTMNFEDFLATNGVNCWRHAMQAGELEPVWDASTGTLSLDLTTGGAGSTKMDGEEFLRRYLELASHGFRFLEIIDPNGLLEDDLTLKPDFLPASGDAADTSQILSLHLQYASNLVAFFDGTTAVALSDGTSLTPPLIGNYQIFVESNLGEDTKWYNALFDDEEHTAILNAMAQTVQDGNADATIATSISPQSGCYDYDYFERTWTSTFSPDPDLFTHLGVNTFTTWCAPEAFLEKLPTLRSDYLTAPWRDKPLSIGAFSVKKSIYDPDINTNDWDRGYGSPLFGKQVARETLSNLELPAKDVCYYSPFDGEGWKGGNLHFEEGWRSDSWVPLFERVWGTGILGETHDDPTAGADEPSIYEPNEGGVAFMTLARYLSTSSPLGSIVVNTNATLDGEHYYSAMFEEPHGDCILALWFFRDYEYGSKYMDYVSGVRDTGFVERRIHDISVPGLGAVASATLISLDGSAPQPLTVRTRPGGLAEIERVALGEMPVLIKLRSLPRHRPRACLTRTANSLILEFPTEAGNDYVVEHSETLSPGQWQPLSNGPHNSGKVTVPVPATQEFFRIRVTSLTEASQETE